ncbi:MAG TPA: hypothetical protein VIJ29_04770 [Candidatus Paceibacterota bacterium]
MSKSRVVTFCALCQEKQCTDDTIAIVAAGFPGFQTPDEVLQKYKIAQQCFRRSQGGSRKKSFASNAIRHAAYLFRQVRLSLTNALEAFFRNCKIHFHERLQKIDAFEEELREMRRIAQNLISDIANYGRSRYIKIERAAQLYLAAHIQVEALEQKHEKLVSMAFA